MYYWDDECLIRELCLIFNSFDDRLCDFVPETDLESIPSASISALSGSRKVREYIDGSSLCEMPFEVSLRINGASPSDRLRAVSFFEVLALWLESQVWEQSEDFDGNRYGICEIAVSDGPVRNRGEEGISARFSAEYCLRYKRKPSDEVFNCLITNCG